MMFSPCSVLMVLRLVQTRDSVNHRDLELETCHSFVCDTDSPSFSYKNLFSHGPFRITQPKLQHNSPLLLLTSHHTPSNTPCISSPSSSPSSP